MIYYLYSSLGMAFPKIIHKSDVTITSHRLDLSLGGAICIPQGLAVKGAAIFPERLWATPSWSLC